MIRLGKLSGRVPNRLEMGPQTFLDGIAGIYYHKILGNLEGNIQCIGDGKRGCDGHAD